MSRPRIEATFFTETLDELNRLGAGDGRGINRVAFGVADRRGREYLDSVLRGLGLSVRRDAAGNTIATDATDFTETRSGAIAVGSHTDTVPHGGPLDGALGVVAAAACAQAIAAAGVRMRHPLEVINFQAEEATFGGTLGSRAMCGRLEPSLLQVAGPDGRSVREHMTEAGIDIDSLSLAVRPPGSLAAYLELHIEQGGILERSGTRLGVVEAIAGIRRYEALFSGTANHAGTTPMDQRDDALVRGAPFIRGARDVAIAHGAVATVGNIVVRPGSASIVPGEVVMTCDLRAQTEEQLDASAEDLRSLVDDLQGELRCVSQKSPAPASEPVVHLLEEACSDLGGSLTMVSGAGHDAMNMVEIAAMGMLFVPSRDGISHAPEEFTSVDDCLLGAQALLDGLLLLDQRLDPGDNFRGEVARGA